MTDTTGLASYTAQVADSIRDAVPRQVPDVEQIAEIARALRVPIASLFPGHPSRSAGRPRERTNDDLTA